MKKRRKTGLDDYIYIRIGKVVKERMRKKAIATGSNMTIWARQTLIKALDAING